MPTSGINIGKLAKIWSMYRYQGQITRYYSYVFGVWWIALLRIYCWVCWWNNFQILWTFGKVTGKK